MTDFLLNSKGDISFGSDDLIMTSNTEDVVRQRLWVKLNTFKGEWFFDSAYGALDNKIIFGKNTKGLSDELLKTEIENTLGVVRLLEYNSIITSDRCLEVTFRCLIEEGGELALKLFINEVANPLQVCVLEDGYWDYRGVFSCEEEEDEDVTPPIASFSIDIIDTGANTYRFTSTSTDNVGVIAWNWDFGDGNTAFGSVVEHTYSVYQELDVTLTVADAVGLTDTDVQTIDTHIDLPYLIHYVLHDTSNFELEDGSPWSDYDQDIRKVISQPSPYDGQTLSLTVGSDFYRYGIFNTGLYTYDIALPGTSTLDRYLVIDTFNQAYINASSLNPQRYDSGEMVLALKYQYDPVGSTELSLFSEGFDLLGVKSSNQIKFRLHYDAYNERFELTIAADTQNSQFSQDYNISNHGGVIPRDENGNTYIFLQFSETNTFKFKFGYPGNFVSIDTGFVAPPYTLYEYGIGRETDTSSHKHLIKYGDSLTATSQQEILTLMQTDTTPDLSVINPIDFTWDFTDSTKMFSNPDGTGINPTTSGDIVRWVENESWVDDKYALECANTTNGYKYIFNLQSLPGVTKINNNVSPNMLVSDYLDLGRNNPDGVWNGVETYPLGKIHMFKISQDDGNFIRAGLGNFNGGTISYGSGGGEANSLSVFSGQFRITLRDDPFYTRVSDGTNVSSPLISIPITTQGLSLTTSGEDKVMIIQRVGYPVVVWVNDYKLTTDFVLQNAVNDADKCVITQFGGGNVSNLEKGAILHKHRIIKNATFTQQELQTMWDNF